VQILTLPVQQRSRLEIFLDASRWRFALCWALAVALAQVIHYALGLASPGVIATRQLVIFVLVFAIAAGVVWPLRERQRRTGLPYSLFALGLSFLGLGAYCIVGIFRILHRGNSKFPYWDILYVGAFAAAATISGVWHLGRAARRTRALRLGHGSPGRLGSHD
jgi:hypothetical protein